VRGAASRLLRQGGRASGCPPVRKQAASGVAGEANRRRRSSRDALKMKTIDEEEERREATVYRRGTFSPGCWKEPGLKDLLAGRQMQPTFSPSWWQEPGLKVGYIFISRQLLSRSVYFIYVLYLNV